MALTVQLRNMSVLRAATAALDGAPGMMTEAKQRVPERVGQTFLAALIANLQGQTVSLAPLSPRYLERKKATGRDPRILISTNKLAASLHVFPGPRGRGVIAGAGRGRVPGSRLTFGQLMAVLEHGSPSRNLPARPLFKLTLMAQEVELRRTADREFGRLWRSHLRRHL